MSPGSVTIKKLLTRNFILLFALLLFSTAAQALPTFRITQEGFADPNANGVIDCGEQFTLGVLLFDDAPVVSPITPAQGTITVPTQTFATGWQYVPGSLELDSALTENCSIVSILSGNAPADDRASFTYSCLPTVNPGGHSYVLAARIRGTYVGTLGPYFAIAEDRLASGEILTSDLTGSNVQGCPLADLALTKTDGGVSVRPGQTVAYTLAFTNNGDPAANVVLRETVPAQTAANLDISSPGWTCSPSTGAGSMCTLSIGHLAAGAAANRTFAVDVLPSAVAPAIMNIATVVTDTPEVTTANNSGSDSTPLDPGKPDLELAKAISSASASPGSTVVFTIDVRNSGTGLTADTAVQETVPAGSTFDPSASSPGWNCSGSKCSFPLGTFAVGASRTLAFAVRLPSPVPHDLDRLDNTACVTTSTPEPTGNNCGSATAMIEAYPDMSITKTLQSGQGVPGSTLVFNLTVRNSGDRDSGPSTLTETVPDFTTAVSSPGWSCSPDLSAGSTCTSLLPGVAGLGGSVSRTFAVTIDNPLPQGADTIANTVCVSAPGIPQDCDMIEVPTDARAMVSLSKELASGQPVPGATIVYSITAQNTGNRASPPITLTETVPEHTTFDANASSPVWQCSAAPLATCTLFVGPLNGGGESLTRLFAVRVNLPLPAGARDIRNTACAEESGVSHCDDLTVMPQASPVLAIQKTLASGSAAPGEVLVYHVAVSNSGNQHAANVVVTDDLPPLTSLEPIGRDGWICKGRQCSLTLPELAAGTTTTLALSVRVAPTIPGSAASLLNQACATDGPMRTVCDSVETPLGGSPELSLEKTYDGPPLRPGIDLPFTLTLTNSGLRDADGVRLRETIPAASTFQPVGSDPRWSCTSPASGSACELTLDAPAQSSASVTFVVRSASPLPPGVRQIANAACLLLADGNATSCDEVNTPLPTYVEATLVDSLIDDRNGNGSLEDGETIRYTLVVSNPSTLPAANLTASTALDSHLALRTGSVSTSDGQVVSGNAPGDTVPTVEIPFLAPGETVTIEFEALAVDASAAQLSEVASQATVIGPDIEAEPSDDPDTEAGDDPTRTPVGQGVVTGVQEIPTLSQLGLLGLSLLLAFTGLAAVRRRRA